MKFEFSTLIFTFDTLLAILQNDFAAKKEGNTKGVLRETIINNQNQQNMSLAFINNINSKETKNCPDIYELSSIVLFLHQKVKQVGKFILNFSKTLFLIIFVPWFFYQLWFC